MRKDKILIDRAKYMYQGGDLVLDANKDKAKKDQNLRLTVGYMFGQALELTLKQLLYDIRKDYAETHKIIILCNSLERALSRPVPSMSLVSVAKFKSIIRKIEENAKAYEDLAYGARYIPDIRFSNEQLIGLHEVTQDLLLAYHVYDVEDCHD